MKCGYINTITIRTNEAGVSAKAITVNNTSDLLISNNTLNFDTRKTQAQAIYIGPTAKGVRVEKTKLNQQ